VLVEEALAAHRREPADSLERLLTADRWARDFVARSVA
jgi:hypothetical protein